VQRWFETMRPDVVVLLTGIKLCRALRLQHGFDAISLMPPTAICYRR
jgi:hypothetical protein